MSLFLFLESNTFKLIRPPEGMDSLKTLLEPQSRPVLVSLDEARGCGSGCGLKCSRGCWEHRAPCTVAGQAIHHCGFREM